MAVSSLGDAGEWRVEWGLLLVGFFSCLETQGMPQPLVWLSLEAKPGVLFVPVAGDSQVKYQCASEERGCWPWVTRERRVARVTRL